MKNKILKICSTKFFADSVLANEINYIIKSGYHLDLACPFDGQPINNKLKCKSINIYISRKLQIISNLTSLFKLIFLIRKGGYDIVHTHNHLSGILGRLAAKIAGVKLIIHTAHGFYFHERMNKIKYYFFFIVEKIVGLITDMVLVESIEDLNTVIKANMLRKNQVVHLGGGVNLNKFNNDYSLEDKNKFKDVMSINKNNFILGITARITIEKGYSELISAFSKLVLEYPNLHLIIIGANLPSERDPYYEDLLNIIKKKGLEEKVLITFDSDKIPQLLSIMDLFLLPSYREGLPRSIMEAMAMKLPVIATNIRGCREEVLHGETGILIQPKSMESLYSAIKQLINDKIKCHTLGLNGYNHAISHFDENQLFKKILRAYEVK